MTNNRWRVETHCHTHYSKDSLITIGQMVSQCRKKGIDRLIVTDHNTAEGGLRWAEAEPDLFIPGEEIMTTHGEILAFFVKETIPPFLSPMETIARLRDQGAFISVSHPFDRLRKGAWQREDLDQIIDHVDAIEIRNARCFFERENEEARAYALEHNVLGTAGSDAHALVEVGQITLLMDPFEGPEDFAESLKTAQIDGKLSGWWVHWLSSAAKWQRKYLRRPLPLTDQI